MHRKAATKISQSVIDIQRDLAIIHKNTLLTTRNKMRFLFDIYFMAFHLDTREDTLNLSD
jgi:hypothetical protein